MPTLYVPQVVLDSDAAGAKGLSVGDRVLVTLDGRVGAKGADLALELDRYALVAKPGRKPGAVAT